jgi:AcrR family transcriptional regulator
MTSGRPDRPRPLRRDAELNRQRILSAAREVFAQRGLEATLDDVARQAALGIGTVYRRFPTKGDLVDALFEERINGIVTLAEGSLANENSWDGLADFAERVFGLLAEDRGLRDVMLGTAYGRDRVAEARERVTPLAVKLVERAQADGYLRDDLRYSDLLLIELMMGSVVDYTRNVRPDVWRRCLTILLDGLRAHPDLPTPLEPAPLSDEQVDRAMRAWPGSHR